MNAFFHIADGMLLDPDRFCKIGLSHPSCLPQLCEVIFQGGFFGSHAPIIQ